MSLRQRALSGGAVLVVRQAIGTLLSLTGVLLVTRVIGPAKYGVYEAADGIVLFLSVMAGWGLGVYPPMRPTEPAQEGFDPGVTLLFSFRISLALDPVP